MPLFSAIFLGIIEGVTEFLPISSTFHLIWASRALELPSSDFQKLFEVVIQSGAILAVISLYAKSVWQDSQLLKKTLVAFLPTALVGFILYALIKNIFFENAVLQLAVFLIVGILFLVFERSPHSSKLIRGLETISYRQAFWVGLAQSLAVIPGVSRAGAVILALLYLGVRRDEAARFSFLLAVPTILVASGFDLYKAQSFVLSSQESVTLTIGFFAAFLTAFLVIKWLVKYLQNHTLAAFGWYRIVLAFVLLAIWAL